MAASGSTSDPDEHPTFLEPSELGTQSYWDKHYDNDLHQFEPIDPSELESWFDDVGAPSKVLNFLKSNDFALSPFRQPEGSHASILDLGCGNGSMLFSLRLQGQFYGTMVGLDYSRSSIELARKLQARYSDPSVLGELIEMEDDYIVPPNDVGCDKIHFEVFDVFQDQLDSASWWMDGGFDLVLDKGTFDAISLSSETIDRNENGTWRLCELYPQKVVDLVRPGGFFLITSCNWTEAELVRWFTTGPVVGELEVSARLQYRSYQFGGQQGQGVATVCFRKKKGHIDEAASDVRDADDEQGPMER